jgi:putative nucleotidyltransferase with HDIG domain
MSRCTILCVDDEEHILSSIERLFVDREVRILKATSADEALQCITSEEVAVVVSDNRMPGMSGIDLLSRVKALSPDTVKVLMTAYADLSTAIDAINKGEIFRFIAKPWEDNVLVKAVEDGIHRYNIIKSFKRKDEASLLSLAQTIELKDPYTRGHCNRVATYALTIANALRLSEEKKRDIKYGSWLHDLGKIGVPEALLNLKGPLSEGEFEIIKKHPMWGAEVARHAQLPEAVVNIILYHHERFDGKGYPSGLKGKDIPLEARITTVADVYDALTTERPYRKAFEVEKALEIMVSMKAQHLDSELVEHFFSSIRQCTIENHPIIVPTTIYTSR